MKKEENIRRLIEMVEGVMRDCGVNYSKVAAMSRQAFFRMVKGGSLKVTTLFEVLDALGLELLIVEKVE